MVSSKQDPFIEAWWSSAGAALYGACGARTLEGWRHVPDSPRRDRARAGAMCALAATSVLIVDAIRVLCAEDTGSIASSYRKPAKQKAPQLGLNMTYYNKLPGCVSNWAPAKLAPANVPLNDPMAAALHTTRLEMDAPKLSPQKLTPQKLPESCRPLKMGPRLTRTFW
ncbi:uncharacterized protein LOC125233527 [Leguminivora glycinivorella]|uniref:uncharacterized protein LOC125233527 n=1 Tax=Leguminivora glycinivorella TaxID=1035111 RepID=UPI00200CB15A|nr:uncharacterized protein LOC125233527 [Leguminivora glycinivorella]